MTLCARPQRHARIAMWLVERFLPVRFEIAEIPDVVSVLPL